MKVFYRYIIYILLLSFSNIAYAQTDSIKNEELPEERRKIVDFKGYLKDLVSIGIPSFKEDWNFDNQIHNRLNFKIHFNSWLTFNAEGRNRIYFGESVSANPLFAEEVDNSLDFFRLGDIIVQEKSFLIHSIIDRANFRIEKKRWQAIVGKQRINWGKTYVWNPNDIFNAYSFFDFDYEERRGTDALLLKYKIASLSSVELACNIDSTFDKLTFAANYKVNFKQYDFQFLLGKQVTDFVLGAGWAGQIKAAGFKGEVSCFQPYDSLKKQATLIGNISFDYTLSGSLTFRLEAIGNSNPKKSNALQFLTQPVTAKTLINNYVSVFASVGYDINPLINANINSIWNVDDNSAFINPTVNFSLNENTDLLIAAQIFTGISNSLYDKMGSYVFTRLKWNF